MDFDPRITSDGMSYGAACGHCNFHFGYVHDVFDEDAKNEEACVQALKHLIAKADTEISDLEDELAIIQCQRKWAEFDEKTNPYEVCCAAFKRRIVSLTSSINKLRNGALLHGHGVFTSLEIQRPAERICDITNDLIKSNFTEPDEQVGDLDNENDLLFTSALPDLDMDLTEQATILESSLEFERQRPTRERLSETTETVSEESTSEAARYINKDLSEVEGIGTSNVKVSTKSEKAGSASEGKSGILTSIETLISQSPYQASNDEAHSKATASRHGQSENCMKGSTTGGNGSTLLAVKTEAIVMDEQDGHHTSLHSGGSDSRAPDNEGKDPVDDYPSHANQTQSVADPKIAYGRQKSSLSCILKPTGQKVQTKTYTDTWLKPGPQRKSKKRKSLPAEDNIGISPSPSSEVEGRSSCLPETNWRKKLKTERDGVCGNPPQVSEAKTNQPKGASRKFSSNQSPKLKVPKAVLGAKDSLATNARSRFVLCLESSNSVEVKSSGSDYANQGTVGSNISTLVIQKTTESPSIDLKSLKQSLLEDPDYFKRQTVPELKKIVLGCKLRSVAKLKKEEIILKLINFLTENGIIQHVSAGSVCRTQDLETKDQLVSAETPSMKEDLERKDQHVPVESASRTQDLETKHHNVSADPASRIHDLERKDQHVAADSALRTQDLEKEDQHASPDSACRTQDLERTDQHVSIHSFSRTQDLKREDEHVSVDSPSSTRDLKTKDQQVSADSVPRTQDPETKDPAEGELAVTNQFDTVANVCHEKEQTA